MVRLHARSTMAGFGGAQYCICGKHWPCPETEGAEYDPRCAAYVVESKPALRLQPLTLREANALVASLHRHHKPTPGMKFAIGCYQGDKFVGAAIVGRPVARMVDARRVAEVTRLVTDGTKNACSILYAAAARAAAGMGYEKIQTYILDSEPGTSLRAAGWVEEATTRGGQWEHTDGKPRRTDQPTGPKRRYAKQLKEGCVVPTGQILKVWPKKGDRSGTVVFADGAKYNTFSNALLGQAAAIGVGQMVEYTLKQNGQYTNIDTIKPLGTPSPVQTAPAGAATAPVQDIAPLVTAIRDLTTTIKEHVAALRATLALVPGPAKGKATAAEPDVTAEIAALQQKLAETDGIGPEAAASMFEALSKRYSKKPAEYLAKAKELLSVHGVAA